MKMLKVTLTKRPLQLIALFQEINAKQNQRKIWKFYVSLDSPIFKAMFHFYTPGKLQKATRFLMCSGVLELEQLYKTG